MSFDRVVFIFDYVILTVVSFGIRTHFVSQTGV